MGPDYVYGLPNWPKIPPVFVYSAFVSTVGLRFHDFISFSALQINIIPMNRKIKKPPVKLNFRLSQENIE